MSKRVLITGAASGIGEATAAALRGRGASVVGLDLRATGDDVLACDVRDQTAVDAAVAAAIERLGGLDVLVNCAGIGIPQSAALAPAADAQAVLDVNLLGPWRVTSAALPALRVARGRVVNVASGLAHISVPFAPAYCMSKRGIVAYSDALRLELEGQVSVTTVYPGYIKTPIHDAATEKGLSLEGVVPEETLGAAVDAMVRAAVGPRRRDVATTPRGALGYTLLRVTPRALVDLGVRVQMKAARRRGTFDPTALTTPPAP